MYRGLMVVNAFLRTTKFDDIYMTLLSAAHGEGMELEVRANAELSAIVDTPAFDSTAFDFVLFWDKDVHLARQLEQRGLRLFNSPQSILWCDDKALTYLRLKQAGIPLPRTILAPKTFSTVGYTTLAFVQEAANSLGFPVVLKECFGSFGQQVYLFHDVDALREKVRSLAGTPLLFQELVHESYGRDARLNVVGGRVVASILRRSTDGDFRSNLSRGGAMAPYSPTPVESALAIRACEVLGLDFAGVDVLFGKDGPILCEVNSNAHFKTTLECTGVNMAVEIMRHIAKRLGE
ncbi:MAG: RimK family alpha-L-glutamate ligase [Clostridiales bacterium]|nr:RimK family alpha-L-glutamate ligase [Clostridiales bacterium]MDO4350076.1 RimK family alpha-L-glutamate ligase [Eubacteriales bacterium]MDY4009443.1 RimK family alpha-L-glutamate ligase [Candidatus Limiplasma sp.]